MNSTVKIFIFFFILIVILFQQPSMYINDEWITGNQINQVTQNHQILYAEGKYRYYENGTPGLYFHERKNILPYSSYLPIVTIPAVHFLVLFGLVIPYLFSALFCILLVILILYWKNNPLFSFKYNTPICHALITGSFIFFFINLYYYQPLPTVLDKIPYEVFAVSLVHLIIFALLLVVIYQINALLFNGGFRIFGTFACICCSSFLFWSSTMKDHIDTVLIFSCILYSFLLFRKRKDPWFCPVSFIFAGLLTWIRPEFGAFIFIALIIIYGGIFLTRAYRERDLLYLGKFLLSALCTGIGVLPLLVNNYCVTGNPFVLAWQADRYAHLISPEIPTVAKNLTDLPAVTDSLPSLLQVILYRITPPGGVYAVLAGLYSIFISPETLKVPIFSLTPLFVVGILILPFLYLYRTGKLDWEEWIDIGGMVVLIGFSIAAYSVSLFGLGSSIGVYPDVRYIISIYLPLNLIGLMILSKVNTGRQTLQKAGLTSAILLIPGICIIFGAMYHFSRQGTFWDLSPWINGIYTGLIFIITGISFLYLAVQVIHKREMRWIYLLFACMVILPLLWQISQLLLVSFYADNFTTYPPLLPAIRVIMESLV